MSKIVLLDTAVCPDGLHCRTFQSYQICGEGDGGKETLVSHGTVCARVLDQFAVDYELISIQILSDVKRKTERPSGLIQHLKEGLSYCLSLKADIICLSSVSSVLSDSRYLFSVTKELSKKSIIVSALDNRRFITVPTCYPFVVGDQSDRENCLLEGELARRKGDALLAEVYANCNIELLRQLGASPSNSFAVPVAAAQINHWLNQKRGVKECLEQLRPYPSTEEMDVHRKGKLHMRPDIPVIAAYGPDDGITYAVCLQVMNQLYKKYHIQTSALCSVAYAYDIRFCSIKSLDLVLEDLIFMEEHYRTDLIFLIVKEQDQGKVLSRIDADVKIRAEDSGVRILFENQELKECAAGVADLLYQIL